MPRRLLRDGQVVVDDWRYLTEIEGAEIASEGAGTETADTARTHVTDANGGAQSAALCAVIIPLERWLREREQWLAHAGRLGVLLSPADRVERLEPDVARLALIAAEFPGPTDGRGYTQGRILRERYRFTGELRAAGYVRRDQLFFLARCGFNSFQLPDGELATATTALATFSAEYQPSNDRGLGRKLQHR